jgi:Ni,Fe-hydrogenase III large subunit
MFDQYEHEHLFVDGVFSFNNNKSFYKLSHNHLGEFSLEEKKSFSDITNDTSIPLWLIRHSLGVSSGEEDTSSFIRFPKKDYNYLEERSKELELALIDKSSIRNLMYNGLKINLDAGGYSHAVGPIHAGIIEPGHFRFFVKGEIIQHLTIRLGFQHRDILNKLIGKSAISAIPVSETISGDSSVAYSTAFSKIFEKAAKIKVDDDLEIIRLILLEVERCAIHIGDIGAMAGDIGYYPLHGVCATDRGVPLGVMEALVGNRFGKGGVFPGEVRLNKRLKKEALKSIADNLYKGFLRVEYEFLRAVHNSTIRERLQECGNITRKMVRQNGFVGMPARCTGIEMDMRKFETLYLKYYPISLHHTDENLMGDAWSRFYLRYLELKASVEWLCKMIPEINIETSAKGIHLIQTISKFSPGIHYQLVEGWRGPVLVVLQLSKDGTIQNSYIRDPSVLNWHALELAVRGELIGDFPLNNKSFNLSYVGFDL